jgi:hypothetical protein
MGAQPNAAQSGSSSTKSGESSTKSGESGMQKQGAQAPASGSSSSTAQTSTSNTNVSVNFTTEQRQKIRTTVLQSSSAPKVSKVDFSLTVGTAVPRNRVKLVAVPSTLIEIQPAWRGFLYFIVNDELVIVDPKTYQIVAIVQV